MRHTTDATVSVLVKAMITNPFPSNWSDNVMQPTVVMRAGKQHVEGLKTVEYVSPFYQRLPGHQFHNAEFG